MARKTEAGLEKLMLEPEIFLQLQAQALVATAVMADKLLLLMFVRTQIQLMQVIIFISQIFMAAELEK